MHPAPSLVILWFNSIIPFPLSI